MKDPEFLGCEGDAVNNDVVNLLEHSAYFKTLRNRWMGGRGRRTFTKLFDAEWRGLYIHPNLWYSLPILDRELNMQLLL